MATTRHAFQFFRAGGVDQLRFNSGADISRLKDLDQKLWVALACPVKGLELEKKTLELLDQDKDGRIRAGEVLAAVKWLEETLRSLDLLLEKGDSIALTALNDGTPAGKKLLAGARRVLTDLGKPTATVISLADVLNTEQIFTNTKFNGDGIVPLASAPDEDTRRALEDVMATHGTVVDRSGQKGVDRARVDAFFTDAAAFVAWSGRGAAEPGLLPLGDRTQAAAQALARVRVKVDDWFTRCRLAAFDTRAVALLDAPEGAFAALSGRDLDDTSADIARLPLSRIVPSSSLNLRAGVNPGWRAALTAFADLAVVPLLGADKKTLSEADWSALQEKLAPHEAWMKARPVTAVEKLGIERLAVLATGDARARISKLIEQDEALAPEFAQIADLERLLLYRRDFARFLDNFVNFSDFYGKRGATFQAGTLYLDGRSCNLVVRVDDAGKHAALAGFARTFLAYCDCSRPATNEKMTIAAAFTDGDSDDLIVGRNGIFYDRKGLDWDATITKVIENPISVRQAFWSPYKRFVRMIEEQVTKRAAAADAASSDKLSTAAVATANADQAKTPAPEANKKVDTGTVAAIGVAVAGLATFISTLLAAFFGLGRWMPLGVLGVLLAISGPSMLIAWLKLRQRNMGPILDANGWAVNGRVKVNVPFGRALTAMAVLPPGSKRSLRDPYAEKKRPWKLYVALVVLIVIAALWFFGKTDPYLEHAAPSWRSTEVLGHWAPLSTATTTTTTTETTTTETKGK